MFLFKSFVSDGGFDVQDDLFICETQDTCLIVLVLIDLNLRPEERVSWV